MIFITGPLYSGKREYACRILGCEESELKNRAIWDVQDLAAQRDDLDVLADELSQYEVVIATEVGGGVVPVDAEERAGREAAGRLGCLLAQRAEQVVRVFCGLPVVLKGSCRTGNADLYRAVIPSPPPGNDIALRNEESYEMMDIYLLRHGETAYNAEKRYLGRSDVSLSAKGLAELIPAGFSPETVYVSPLRRTWETAGALFPAARPVVIDDFREMDFGVFEGKNYQEMADFPEYQAWIDSGCLGKVPGGEKKSDFCHRTCEAFARLVDQALDAGEDRLVIVAHGGTQMAVMERFALPARDYFSWNGPNGGGFVLDASPWRRERKLTLRRTVRYTREGPECC